MGVLEWHLTEGLMPQQLDEAAGKEPKKSSSEGADVKVISTVPGLFICQGNCGTLLGGRATAPWGFPQTAQNSVRAEEP